MPTRYLSRTFCKTCVKYTLFENKICMDCKQEYIPYSMDEVPVELIGPQRERYRNRKQMSINSFLTSMANDFHSTTLGKTEINEDDAGLEWIMKEKLKKREEERKVKREEQEKYKNVGRNDICLCGSGKKFKKCHYPIISN